MKSQVIQFKWVRFKFINAENGFLSYFYIMLLFVNFKFISLLEKYTFLQFYHSSSDTLLNIECIFEREIRNKKE